MPDEAQSKKLVRRKIDFSRIGNKITVLLYQKYMGSGVFFVPFTEIAAAISSEPRNAVWDELHNLEHQNKVVQKTEARQENFFAAVQGRRPETYEVKVDGYKISRTGIDDVNKLSDEMFEVLASEIATEQEAAPKNSNTDVWQPLALDRESTEFKKATEAAEIALNEIEGSNGYASTKPDERNSIVETIKTSLKVLKEGIISRGQIIEGLIKPLRFIAIKFADASMGELSKRAANFLWTLITGM